MIHGYPAKASVWPGQRLVLHVASDTPRFRVGFYRYTGPLVHMGTSGWRAGEAAPERGAGQDWDWPPYVFTIPPEWPPGVYLAHLEQPGAGAPRVAMHHAAALFVVRANPSGKLLYKLPLATYNAYNHAGGACYYANPPRSAQPPGARLSFRRPGCGIGGPVFGAPDHYDASSPRQTFAHWDARFIGWLYQNGYAPQFCTDLDIHFDPDLCRSYRMLLSVGHDEYWSVPMRDHVEDYIADGGNAAFFSANLCWWRIHIIDAGTAMVCHQGGPNGALDRWRERPEEALAGVSYRHGGGWWDGPRRTGGFAVQDPAHWAFAGTGLQRGQVFGADTWPPLAGYECDGAPLAGFDHASGIATLAPQATGVHLLAACPLDEGWQERPAAGIHAATMGVFTRGGTVFSAGTTDWAQVLGSGQDARVDTITRNVLDGLLNGAAAARSI